MSECSKTQIRLTRHTLIIVIMFAVLSSIVITSLGEERERESWSKSFSCIFVYLSCKRYFISVFSISWCRGWGTDCDRGTPWNVSFNIFVLYSQRKNKPQHDKTNRMTCAPSEDSDQPRHAPSLIKVFAVRSMCS